MVEPNNKMSSSNSTQPRSPVRSFEDLACWQMARELTNAIYRITKDKKQFADWSLANQIQRAVVSVMSNIAEGFERGSREDQISFYFIAKASCGEVRCQLYIAFDQGYISKQELDALLVFCRRTSATIYRYIESIKVQGYKGLRYRNSAVEENKKEREEFEKYVNELAKKSRGF